MPNGEWRQLHNIRVDIEQLIELLCLKEWIMRNWMLAFVTLLSLVLFLKGILKATP